MVPLSSKKTQSWRKLWEKAANFPGGKLFSSLPSPGPEDFSVSNILLTERSQVAVWQLRRYDGDTAGWWRPAECWLLQRYRGRAVHCSEAWLLLLLICIWMRDARRKPYIFQPSVWSLESGLTILRHRPAPVLRDPSAAPVSAGAGVIKATGRGVGKI